MDNLLFQIKQSIKFLLKYKIILFPFLFILLFLILCSINPTVLFFFTNIKITNGKNIKYPRRLDNNHSNTINEFENDEFFHDVNLTLVEGMNTNLSNILIYYEFIDSISHTYYGDWENLYIKKINSKILKVIQI